MEDNLTTPTKAPRKHRQSPVKTEMELKLLQESSSELLIELILKSALDAEEYQQTIEQLENERGEIKFQVTSGLTATFEKEFSSAKNKINELLKEREEMDQELSGRGEALSQLRISAKAAMAEKKELDKRYREQTESFDSERQSFYDQEQHYKLRISNLCSAPRKARISDKVARETEESAFPLTPVSLLRSQSTPGSASDASPPGSSSFPMQQDSLATLEILNTANVSLTSTTRTLQKELTELKKVNQELQDENESYELLLGEKTMNGQLLQGNDLFKRSWVASDDEGYNGFGNGGLESVGESEEEGNTSDSSSQSDDSPRKKIHHARSTSTLSPNMRGKRKTQKKRPSGGLSLAAEIEASEESELDDGKKQLKHQPSAVLLDGDALRSEVKSLREANKALTLYVSKIVDRVCSQEGFEKVLAVDYKLTPKPTGPFDTPTSADIRILAPDESKTLFKSTDKVDHSSAPILKPVPPPAASNRERTSRPMSIDWKSASNFFSSALSRSSSSTSSAPLSPPLQPAGFKPMLLHPIEKGSSSRRVSGDEDEEDLRERERLKSELALHGISRQSRHFSTGASIPTLSTSTGLPTTNKRASLIMAKSPNLGSSTNSTVPEPVDLDQIYSTPTIQSLVAAEQLQIAELQAGIGSGLTDIQFKRKSSIRRGGSSIRSNSSTGDATSSVMSSSRSRMNSSSEGTGLGLNLGYGGSNSSSPNPNHDDPLLESHSTRWNSPPTAENGGELEELGWAGRFRKSWTSPNPST